MEGGAREWRRWSKKGDTKKEFLAFDEEQSSNFMFHIPHFGLSRFMNVHFARKSC